MSWTATERPVFEPHYWKERLEWALKKGCLHHSVYNTDIDTWTAIEKKHRDELHKYVRGRDCILDVGCAYGRLIDLLPSYWTGQYLGVDVSPDFIEFARSTYPGMGFSVLDLRDLSSLAGRWFDWGVAVSVKRVVIGHAGEEVWDGIEKNLLKVCRKLLILDYDPEADGELVG